MTAESPPIEGLRRDHLQARHGLANIGWLLLMHGVLLTWLWSGRSLVPYSTFLLLSVIACLIHQRILSEWFHEATHWNLVPGRHLNDVLADLLIGPFNGTRVRSNRPGHFRHHAVSTFFTQDDPDTCGVAAANHRELRAGLWRDVTGRTALATFFATARAQGQSKPQWGWYIFLLLPHASGFALTFRAGRADVYALYFITLLTLYPMANRFRLYAQHGHFETDGTARLKGSPVSRSFHAGLIEQTLLQSPMIMYHHQHHAWPNLPYRALKNLSKPSDDLGVFGRGGLRLAARIAGGLPA